MMKQWRIATLGDYRRYYSYFLYGTMEGAIRCGAWFRPISIFGQSIGEIEEQINFFKPHILFCHGIFSSKSLDKDSIFGLLLRMRKKGIRVVYHMGDARSEPRYPHNISSFVDLCLVNHGLIKEFSSIWGVPCYHWSYMSLYQKDFGEEKKELKAAVAFTGAIDDNRYHKYRSDFVKRLQKEIEVKVYPSPEVGNTRFQTAEVSASTNVIMDVQMEVDLLLYLDVRPFQYIGSGALFFHDESASMNAFFESKVHYVKYKRGDVQDFIRKYHHYVEKHPDKGKEIRKKGFEFCQAFHSTKERVQFVIDIIDGKRVKNRIYLKDLPSL